MTDQDRIEAAQGAKQAMAHLSPAFDAVEATYSARLTEIATSEPWAVDKIRSLAMALKVSQGVRAHIAAIIGGGDIAETNETHRRKIEKLSPERRRILGL
jgi:hypothetical protein